MDRYDLPGASFTVTQREGKRVLLNHGADWCRGSQAMHRLLRDDPAISRELSRHYVLVLVDVNRREGEPRNTPLVSRFGDPLRRGIPVLLMLRADGTLLNRDPDERLADSDHSYPTRALGYRQKWSRQTMPWAFQHHQRLQRTTPAGAAPSTGGLLIRQQLSLPGHRTVVECQRSTPTRPELTLAARSFCSMLNWSRQHF